MNLDGAGPGQARPRSATIPTTPRHKPAPMNGTHRDGQPAGPGRRVTTLAARPHHAATLDASHAIWAAVDTLTRPTTTTVHRDNGDATYTPVPSLWNQAQDALHHHTETRSPGAGAARERSILDLDLLEVCSIITDTVRHELRARALRRAWLTAQREIPGPMRTLAAHVIGHEPTQLWWWEYRFASWARLLAGYLHVGEHTPTAVQLRNAACPHCGTRHVVVATPDGDRVVPALIVEFRAGLVQAARCQGCDATWWRGQLERLALLIGEPAGV